MLYIASMTKWQASEGCGIHGTVFAAAACKVSLTPSHARHRAIGTVFATEEF